MKTILLILSIATSALSQGLYFGSSVPALHNWVTGGVPTGALNTDGGVTIGVQFTPTANITVTALGFWVHANTEDNIPLGIWADGGTLLGTVTLKLSNYSNGTMGYTNLATAIPLTSGSTYRIAGIPKLTSTGAYYDSTGTAPTLTSDATLNGSCYHIGLTLTFPETTTSPGLMGGPCSFTYTKP